VHSPAVDITPVRHSHHAASGNGDPGSVNKGSNKAQQCIRLQNRVRVNSAEDRVQTEIDAGVERVGLSPVGLVDNHKVGVRRRLVDSADELAGQHTLEAAGAPPEIEGIDQPPESPIPGAIVDEYNLEKWIVEHEERPHILDDVRLLVVGGRQDRHRRGKGGSQ
jgi:hypothetical protein